MADIGLAVAATQATPLKYTIPAAQELLVKQASANYDGSGAGGSYVPTLQILYSNGQVGGSWPIGPTLAAGASADVSWFPGVKDDGDIAFNTLNVGQWLDIATSVNGPSGSGINLYDGSTGGISIGANQGIAIASNIGPLFIGVPTMNIDGDHITIASTADLTLQSGGGAGLSLPTTKLGFYGKTPTVQAAHPVTLADVITALTNLGLTM